MTRPPFLFVASFVVLAGCATETEQHLLDATAALETCDLRGAHASFRSAYDSDPSHPDAALGFALTDTILLPEDPEITAGLARIGFTAPLDTEMLWGRDGILARMQRNESCESVSDFARVNIPYPPIRDSGVDGTDLVAPDLTAQELIDRLEALDGRFERLAQAYETAAEAMGAREVTIEGGCGTGRLVVQAPELYTLSAAFVLLRAALVIAPTYDWSFLVADLFGRSSERNAAALQRLLRVVDASRAANASDLLVQTVDLVDRAAAAAAAINTTVPDALFDWTVMDRTFLSDFRLFASRARASLTERQPEVIPYMVPALSVDVSAYLTSPPDQASLPAPLWSYVDDGFGGYLQTNDDGFGEMLRPYFTPDPFADTASFRWDLGDRWRDLDFTVVFDPGERFATTYDCRP